MFAPKLKRLTVNLGVFTVSCALCGLAAEVFVQSWFGEQPKFPRHVIENGLGIRVNQPNAVYRHKSADVDVEFRINSKGLRSDREFSYAKPPGSYRVIAVGDSFTAGYEVAVENTFASVAEQRLSAMGIEAEIINAGISGYSNAEALAYLERELFRYEPDAVVLSFFANDLVDNVRADLYALEDDVLVERNSSYVPAGRLGNFLNTNLVFNWLAGNSDAFVKILQDATLAVKGGMVDRNLQQVDAATAAAEVTAPDANVEYEQRLAAAIIDRMYQRCRERNIEFVVQSIPVYMHGELVDAFPYRYLDTGRPGFTFIETRSLLEPHKENDLLYWRKSHGHWTPHSHRISGDALAAELLVKRPALLSQDPAGPQKTASHRN